MHLAAATVVVKDAEVVKDYNLLDNKPSINGVELVGNKTAEELHIPSGSQPDEPVGPDDPGDVEIATLEDIDALFD